jgi:branched-chain amino acid aminotransferase
MLQEFDPKNENILVWVGDRLYPRKEARVSVFDSSVQGGDAVWEGLRVYQGRVFCLEQHLTRLHSSAHALAFADIPSAQKITAAIFETLKANGMKDGVHIRLTLTRGEKITSGMDPRLNQKGSCLIVLAEWKPPVYDREKGIRAMTSSIVRNSPRFLDSKIHHNNLLNNILAKIKPNAAGVDAALMLDTEGFAAELNDCNIFMSKRNPAHRIPCLPAGDHEGVVIQIAHSAGISVEERNISLTELYNADEVFATGTMGELTPIVEIDGRRIENRSGRGVLEQVQTAFDQLKEKLGTTVPF